MSKNLVSLLRNISTLVKMKKSSKKIKVIDLFAGPGGLGEGFSNCKKDSPFEIAMSVEFEKHAHKTLTLRALYRKLSESERSALYLPYIQSKSESEKEQNFKRLTEGCSAKWSEAQYETMGEPHALGNPERWRKIKAGEPLTEDDFLPTKHEQAIMQRIDKIKAEHKGPLIVIGGPPCQAYSVNGRNRIRAEKDYSPENDERFFLYQEYLKVLDRADPDIFVMENVEGILTAKLANGEYIFPKIKDELVMSDRRSRDEQYDIYSFVKAPYEKASQQHGPRYRKNSDYVITASDHGVPQNRKRVILLGVKHKYGPVESTLKKSLANPKTAELLTGLPVLRSGMSDQHDDAKSWLSNWRENKSELSNLLSKQRTAEDVGQKISQTKFLSQNPSRLKILGQGGMIFNHEYLELRSFYIESYKKTFRELLPIKEAKNLADEGDGKGNSLFCSSVKNNAQFTKSFSDNYPELYSWLNRDIDGAINHETRGHMKEDLKRYMFSAAWASANKDTKSPSPKSRDFPLPLSPRHGNWHSGHHADRFRTVGSHTTPYTITSHLRKDGHAQIHYDIAQNRSITVREAARIQTFPDDYYFEGSQGWQFQQVGNAVPSFLAKQIASLVLEVMKKAKLF